MWDMWRGSTVALRRQEDLIAAGVAVRDKNLPNLIWMTKPIAEPGDLVTHSNGYNCRLGLVEGLFDRSWRNDHAPDGWCHIWQYSILWLDNGRRSSNDGTAIMKVTTEALMVAREEAGKRGYDLSTAAEHRLLEAALADRLKDVPRD